MTFGNLADRILDKQRGTLAFGEWPSDISPPPKSTGGLLGFGAENDFWGRIKKLRQYTDTSKDNFSKEHHGSTGWEYELIMAYVGEQFFYSTADTSKDYEKVSSGHSISIKPGPISQESKPSLIGYVSIDDKQVGKIYYRGREEIEKRNEQIRSEKYKFGFIAHFHSHPLSQYITPSSEVVKYYSFFSNQDMHALLSGRTPLLGLITDQAWLAARTSSSSMPDSTKLHELTNLEVKYMQEGKKLDEAFKQQAGGLLRNHQIVLYHAEFGGNFKRVN